MSQEIQRSILAACNALFAPGQVVEARILCIGGKDKFNASGWFNDYAALAEQVVRYDITKQFHPEGIYVTLNPLHPACISRSQNKIIERISQTSSDRDVIRRSWFFIDVDPIRPSGVPSSDTELAYASSKADAIEAEFGHPHLRAVSSNGIHLLYRIDLPNDGKSKELIRGCLAVLAAKFNDDKVAIDKAVFNAARIIKLWGTVTRKGIADTDRPHRRSALVTPILHADIAEYPTEKLETLAASNKKSAPKKSAKPNAKSKTPPQPLDLHAFIAAHSISVRREEPWDGGTRFILDHCVFDPSHDRTSAAMGVNKDGALFYKCQHDTCIEKKWRDVRELFEGPRGNGLAKKTDTDTDDAGSQSSGDPNGSTDSDGVGNPWELATQFIRDEFTDHSLDAVVCRRHAQTVYVYSEKDHCYQSISEDEVRVRVRRFLSSQVEKVTFPIVRDTADCFESMITVPTGIELPVVSRFDTSTMTASLKPLRRDWISLRNGIVDLDKALNGDGMAEYFMPHTTEWFSTSSLPFDFPQTSEAAAAPRWMEFLDEIHGGDTSCINLMQEAFGYSFIREPKNESFFVLQGGGRNGKSTILNVLAKMVGEANVSAISASQLSGEYAAAELYGKTINICADMKEMDAIDEGLIKFITSGDLITANRKYKTPLRFRPTTRLWFSTNVLPRLTDPSLGIWRRLMLIPFDYTVEESRIDIKLLETLVAELPGIFLWAIQGLMRLRLSGSFTRSDACERAKREYRIWCFPLLTFVDECCDESAADGGEATSVKRTTGRLLWNIYRRWCTACGLSKVKPLHTFLRDLKSLRPDLNYGKSSDAGSIEIRGISEKVNLDLQETLL